MEQRDCSRAFVADAISVKEKIAETKNIFKKELIFMISKTGLCN